MESKDCPSEEFHGEQDQPNLVPSPDSVPGWEQPRRAWVQELKAVTTTASQQVPWKGELSGTPPWLPRVFFTNISFILYIRENDI